MTDQSTISQLNPILVLADADLLLADQSQGDGTYVTKKITSANVSAKFSADAGAAASGYADAAAASAATAATSETNAAASATTATTKAGVATTKAGDAASSAAAAAISETNAATSETNAAASETNAAASEAAASASETNAASSETAAATSETNAAASAAIGVSTLRFTAASLAAAKALLSSGVSLQSSATMTLMGRAGFFDGYEGDFVYDGSDSTTTFPNDMYGFVDGADRRWKRKLAGYGSVNWSPVKIDFSEDAAAYIRSAIDQAIANKLSRVKFRGRLLVASAIYDKEASPHGLTLEGTGYHPWLPYSGVPDDEFSAIKNTAAGYAFNFSEDLGTIAVGRLIFRDFGIKCTDGAGGAFSLNYLDQSGTDYTPTDSSSTPNYLQSVEFSNVLFEGAATGDTTQTGDGIRAKNAFEIVTRENVTIRWFRRGVFGKGIDNCRFYHRGEGNGRNIHLEKSGTFGNNARVDLAYNGPTADAGEDQYAVYDAAEGSTHYAGLLEQTSASTAGFYLNGSRATLINPFIASSAPAFELGPEAVGTTIVAPQGVPSSVTPPIIHEATNYEEASGAGAPSTVLVYGADYWAQQALGKHPRIRYLDAAEGHGFVTTIPNTMVIDDNGLHPSKQFVVTPHHFPVKWTGRGLTGIVGMIADSTSQSGYVAKLDHTDSTAGFMREFTIPGEIKNGDIIRVVVRARTPTALGSGHWKVAVYKNGSTLADSKNLTDSATHANTAFTYGPFGPGLLSTDVVEVAVINSSADQDLYFEGMTIDIVQAAIASPTATGTLAATNAAVDSILAALAIANITA